MWQSSEYTKSRKIHTSQKRQSSIHDGTECVTDASEKDVSVHRWKNRAFGLISMKRTIKSYDSNDDYILAKKLYTGETIIL